MGIPIAVPIGADRPRTKPSPFAERVAARLRGEVQFGAPWLKRARRCDGEKGGCYARQVAVNIELRPSFFMTCSQRHS